MSEREITVTVNGEAHTETIEDRKLLVHFLRDDLDLTGTHQGCVVGKCGACTVLHDEVAKKSCMLYAVQMDGESLTTVEGLSDLAVAENIAIEDRDAELHPLQKGFTEEHGLQCGFCTPGMLMSSLALLTENPSPDEDEIKEAISGNICRCTGYNSIVDSIKWASDAMDGEADRDSSGIED